MCIVYVSSRYHIHITCIMYVSGDTATEVVEDLTKAVLAGDPTVQKRPEGGVEGVPTNRQVRNLAFRRKKESRENGV